MKQRLLQFNHMASVVLCGCLVACLSSCVDDKYDLDNGISTEVKVLDGLTLPIGAIEPIYMSDIINVDSIEMLELVDGKYVVSMSDTTSMDFDLMGEGDALSIAIAPIDKSIKQAIADNTAFPSFPISVSKQATVESGLEPIALSGVSSTIAINEPLALNFPAIITQLAATAAYIEPRTVTNISVPLPVEPVSAQMNVAPDMECPAEVSGISDIEFGDNGEGVALTLKLDVSAFASGFSNFEWSAPSITLTFPEGFVLENGTNRVTFSSTPIVGSVGNLSTKIMGYDKTLVPTADNKMPAIAGEIKCEIAGALSIVSATTDRKPLDVTSPLLLSVSCGALSIADLTIALADIVVPIEEVAVDQPIAIDDIPSNIKSVDYVAFEQGSNAFNLSLTKVQLPAGLSVTNSESVKIGFPKSLFEMSNAASDVDNYYMEIPTSSLVGSGTIVSSINIDKIKLADCPIVDGAMSLNPGITMAATDIVIGGELSLSDFNDYVANYNTQSLDVSAEALSLSVDEAQITTNEISVELPQQDTTITVAEEIPSVLKALYSVGFQSPVSAKLEVAIDGLPCGTTAGNIKFDNYTITFPRFLKFAAGEVDDQNRLVINESVGSKLDPIRAFSKTMHIESMDFDDPQYSDIITAIDDDTNQLNIDIPIKMEGNMLLESGSVSTDIDSVKCDIRFALDTIKVGRVTGEIATDMLEIAETVDLSDLSEGLDLGDATITLSNPSIALSVTNPLPIGLELSRMNLIPYKGGQALKPIATTQTITIAAADIDDTEGVKSNIVLEAKPSNLPGHYQIAGLERLLADMPDSLMVDIKAGVAGDRHTIDLSRKSYSVALDYAVNVPLEFDDLYISYTDTLGGLSLELGEDMMMMPEIELQLDVTSTLPLSIEISELTALDSLGAVLSLPDMFPADSKISGSSNGEPVLSKFHIHLSDNLAGDLDRLDGLKISVAASIDGSNGAVAFRDDQYIQFGLKVRLPNGVTMDVEDMLDNVTNGSEDQSGDPEYGNGDEYIW